MWELRTPPVMWMAGARGRKRKADDRYVGLDDYLPRAQTSLAVLRSNTPTRRPRCTTAGSVRPQCCDPPVGSVVIFYVFAKHGNIVSSSAHCCTTQDKINAPMS
mgnify:CR=1 FL=1